MGYIRDTPTNVLGTGPPPSLMQLKDSGAPGFLPGNKPSHTKAIAV